MSLFHQCEFWAVNNFSKAPFTAGRFQSKPFQNLIETLKLYHRFWTVERILLLNVNTTGAKVLCPQVFPWFNWADAHKTVLTYTRPFASVAFKFNCMWELPAHVQFILNLPQMNLRCPHLPQIPRSPQNLSANQIHSLHHLNQLCPERLVGVTMQQNLPAKFFLV